MKKISRFNRIDFKDLQVDESIFSIQNGLIGIRGNFCEGYNDSDYKQSIINGYYNFYDYKYEENSPDFPQVGQRIINVIDGQSIELLIDNETINLENSKLESLERHFDLEKGKTKRIAKYKTKQGYEIIVDEEKLVSFTQKELFIIKLKVSSPNYNGPITIRSKLQLPNKMIIDSTDSRINVASNDQLILLNKSIDKHTAFLEVETTKSALKLGCSMTHSCSVPYSANEKGVIGEIQYDLHKEFELIKYIVYTPETIHKSYEAENKRIAEIALSNGYDYYQSVQEKYLADFWDHTFIEVDGEASINQSILYNLYQLNSSSANDERLSIPAKGLTGEGYEGHYFWDTEIYMIPFFTITNPEKAKKLLLNRYATFDKGKEVARMQGASKGVKIPWRTINGDEASPYYPAGSAQYHINSDVAYSVIKYVQFTHDLDFMIDYGFEMLLETARFLFDVGNYYDGYFHLNNVTGPDEYTAIVNDNYYTNSMAKYHFETLCDFYDEHHDSLNKVISRLDVTTKEIAELRQAAKAMKLTYSDELKIILQDDSFLQKPAFDFNKLPVEKFPLILHYHPLFIYRHQILKQADALLSMFLLDYDDLEIYQKTFDYYLPKTTHDSSLSKCIHAIVAFRLGKTDLGYNYFEDILKIDMENTHHNTNHGIHIANSGGIYLTLLYGIIGFRIKPNGIVLRPRLPKEIKTLRFKFYYNHTEINITLNKTIEIRVDKEIELGIYDDMIKINDTYRCDYKIKKKLNQ